MAKVSKKSVNYRRALLLRNCGNCSMFRLHKGTTSEGTCTLVEGTIHPKDVCDEWERRSSP